MDLISPSDAPIGNWKIKIETSNEVSSQTYEHDGDFWLLFNPWCNGDMVHMGDTQFLDEYIISDVGKIWIGAFGSCKGREWIFGQFDKCVLPATMFMLDRAGVKHEKFDEKNFTI